MTRFHGQTEKFVFRYKAGGSQNMVFGHRGIGDGWEGPREVLAASPSSTPIF